MAERIIILLPDLQHNKNTAEIHHGKTEVRMSWDEKKSGMKLL